VVQGRSSRCPRRWATELSERESFRSGSDSQDGWWRRSRQELAQHRRNRSKTYTEIPSMTPEMPGAARMKPEAVRRQLWGTRRVVVLVKTSVWCAPSNKISEPGCDPALIDSRRSAGGKERLKAPTSGHLEGPEETRDMAWPRGAEGNEGTAARRQRSAGRVQQAGRAVWSSAGGTAAHRRDHQPGSRKRKRQEGIDRGQSPAGVSLRSVLQSRTAFLD